MVRVPRSRLVRWSAIVASVLVLAACSDGGESGDNETAAASPTTVDADTYAGTVCGAINDWIGSIEEGNQTLQGALENETNLENVKQRLLEFLDETLANTDDLVATLGDTGAPDVENGEQVHGEIQQLLDQARSAFADARDTVDGLDANDPQALGQGLQEVGTSLQSAFAGVENPIEQIESPELEEAFEANESCDSLGEAAA